GATWGPRRVELHPSPGGRQATIDGKVVERDPGGLDVTSLRERLRRVPAPVVDTALAVALAVTLTIGIRVAPGPGARPDALAYACGLIIAALVLARRRWPLAVRLLLVWLHQHLSRGAAVGGAGHRLGRRPPPAGRC